MALPRGKGEGIREGRKKKKRETMERATVERATVERANRDVVEANKLGEDLQ
ncbi:hypothetical protein PROFUN_04321 [Planoprotostelium fungivorum]|uniref:Uncharacterized protein n=1 Tax=Planoprotostelium fungivorum TaxID=1890364 RepID=A0A2P6NV51_9EUKA|nr:hypothetical protein PROFUN_04321 [Planoprotostelium fungivorum]